MTYFPTPHFYISPTPSPTCSPAPLLSLSPLATATVSPDSSWYRPNPNTYQNTTVITVNRMRTNIKLKFENGSIMATNATPTLLTATSAADQGYILFNNTVPGFANKTVNFTVDGVFYANKTANASGFISFNYTNFTASGSSHTFEWSAEGNGIASGRTVYVNLTPLPNVNVSLYDRYDVLYGTAVKSGADGTFQFTNVPIGSYYIVVNKTLFVQNQSSLFEISSDTTTDIGSLALWSLDVDGNGVLNQADFDAISYSMILYIPCLHCDINNDMKVDILDLTLVQARIYG